MPKFELLLNDYQTAVTQLENALKERTDDDLKQAGCIQYFEFCFELAWKTVKAFFEYKGMIDCNSPRDCMKMAFKANLIDNENVWIEMLENRNLTVHTYSIETALDVYKSLPAYLIEMKNLISNIQHQQN
ncbi:MAG: nucleotidyltransferase substrate binding protein [Bacteroidota bacterium]|nr:nucleotidyltransferase substrate binding protein [Bacteroidota bacterium]